MRDFTRASHIPLRFVLLLICVAGAPLGAVAQDCPELPVVELQLEDCGRLNFVCQNRNKQRQAEWQDQMRRFNTPTEFAKADGTTPTQSIEYQIGGCWGAIVNIDVNAEQLTSLRYELLAPSGSTVAAEQLNVRGGAVTGRPLELPESGLYRMRLVAGSAAVPGRVCEKRQSPVNPLSNCVAWKNVTTYPYKFTVAFRGNPEAQVLRVGDRGEGTVTQAEPRSRRVSIEAGQHAKAIVRATGGQVTCRVQREDRSTLPVTAAGGGCEVVFPETDRDATYMVAMSSAANAPVGVSILVEETAAPARAPEPGAAAANTTTRGSLQLGADIEGVFELAGPPGAQDAVQWGADVPAAGAYSLTVVPSGLAALEVELTLYNVKTEELVIDRVRVANRQVIPLTFAVAGPHVLLIKPLKYDAQRAQAKYTVRLERGPTAAPGRGATPAAGRGTTPAPGRIVR